ncbi:MAG: c-type cytochrome [Gammaproteobacteria bacterium]
MRRNVTPRFFQLSALTLAACVIVGCGGYSSQQPQPIKNTNSPNGLDAALVASGKALYEVRCDNCHGVDGRGTAEATSLLTVWDEDDLIDAIENHDPPLPSLCADECAAKTAAYILATFQPDPKLANEGKSDYDEQCALCHGIIGEGGSGGGLTPDVCGSCTDIETLADRIDLTMPTQDITMCDRTVGTNFCADETAKYILAGFVELDEDGNIIGDSNGGPSFPPPNNGGGGGQNPDDCPTTGSPSTPDTGEGFPNNGRSMYMNQCAVCHGQNGEGIGLEGTKLTDGECETCTDLETITAYTDKFMPTEATAAMCSDTADTNFCARETSAYILSGFQEVSARVNNNTVTSSSTQVTTSATADDCPTTPPGNGGGDSQVPPESCEHWSFLFNDIYDTILRSDCQGCHGFALAQGLKFYLTDDYNQDLAAFYDVAVLEHQASGLPLVLAKPTLQAFHGGFQRFKVNSTEYKAMKKVTDRILDPTCSSTSQ